MHPWVNIVVSSVSLLFILGSFYHRIVTGLTILWPRVDNPQFIEHWRSGGRHLWVPFLGGKNCLWVAIAGDKLHFGLLSPFILANPFNFSGIERAIECRDILSIDAKPSILLFFRRGWMVDIRYRVLSSDKEQHYFIQVRELDKFRAVLDDAKLALRKMPN